MFSSQILIDVLYKNFLEPLNYSALQMFPTWSSNPNDLGVYKNLDYSQSPGYAFFFHEEPMDSGFLENLRFYFDYHSFIQGRYGNPAGVEMWGDGILFLANSEISNVKKNYVKKYNLLDWYFFYHGFATLDHFNHYRYFPVVKTPQFSHLFISYNHLITLKRSYRLQLIAELIDRGLDQHGLISAPLLTNKEIWFNELYKNKNTELSTYAKKLIFQTFNKSSRSFVLDTENVQGTLSAEINLDLNSRAFLQLVTETVYYDKKLHLTEKIFKPIVSRQPFILVGATGNLAYLKTYGFKTFDRWWDESYDNEPGNDQRMLMIIKELERLSKLSKSQLYDIHREMSDILDYNREHFFNNFKKVIVDELVDNFEKCIHNYNHNRSERFRIPTNVLDYTEIKKRLYQ